MFSLIITVAAIALVAALALSTLYYGGAAFSKGASRAEASKVVLQGQQLLGAADLFFTENRRWPDNIEELVSRGYLKQSPSAHFGMPLAEAAGTAWSMPIARVPMFSAPTAAAEVCAEVNLAASLRTRGVLRYAYTGLVAQCYGTTEGGMLTVFRKSADTPLRDGNDGLPAGDIVVGAPPTDPASPDWSVPPGRSASPGGGGGPVTGAQGLSVPASVDFGAVVFYTDSNYRDVVVRNTGTAPVRLLEFNSSHSNFYVDDSECYDDNADEYRTLAPGQSCTLYMDYYPSVVGAETAFLDTAAAGTDNQQFSVTTLLTGLGVAPAPAKLDVVFDNTVVLGNSLFLGNFALFSSNEWQYLTIRNSGGVPISIDAAQITGLQSFASHAGGCVPGYSVVLSPGSNCEVLVGLNTRNAAGTQSGVLNVVAQPLNAGAAQLTRTVNISAAVVETPPAYAVVVSPDSVELTSVPLASSMPVPVTVRNVGTSPVTFARVQTSGDWLFETGWNSAPNPHWTLTSNTCGSTLAPNATCTITMTYNVPRSVLGSRMTDVLHLAFWEPVSPMQSNDPVTNQPRWNVDVPVAGSMSVPDCYLTGTCTPADFGIALTPAVVDFGAVAVGSTSAPQTLTLSNLSQTAQTINIERDPSSGAAFTSAPGGTCASTVTLAPGQSCTVVVRYTSFEQHQHVDVYGWITARVVSGSGHAIATASSELKGAAPRPACVETIYEKQHLSGGYQPNRLGIDQFIDPPGWYDYNGTSTYYPNGWAYELVAVGSRSCD